MKASGGLGILAGAAHLRGGAWLCDGGKVTNVGEPGSGIELLLYLTCDTGTAFGASGCTIVPSWKASILIGLCSCRSDDRRLTQASEEHLLRACCLSSNPAI